MSTPTTDRDATVRQLAATGMSHRAIARQVGIHHNTVARIVLSTPAPADPHGEPPERATAEPPGEPERATGEPPAPTSGERPRTRLMHELPTWLIQDLNILTDPFTGELSEPAARAIHTAAERRRAEWSANAERRARQSRTTEQ